MACFIVPATGAVISHICQRQVKKREAHTNERIAFSTKLGWLTRLLGGGAFLLAFEHVWHGEVVPWFPFLTATSDPTSTSEMLHEMATAGTTMLLLCVAVWGVMLAIAHHLETKAITAQEDA
ncbi:MAG: hypothetical protein IKY83_13185 [Proteobacteria bacterium]|nr:hypothetical protein [Pseudomonadota bacterium]